MQYTASGRLCQSLFLRFFTFCISFLRKLESKRKRRQRGTAAAVFSCSDKAEARRRRRKTSRPGWGVGAPRLVKEITYSRFYVKGIRPLFQKRQGQKNKIQTGRLKGRKDFPHRTRERHFAESFPMSQRRRSASCVLRCARPSFDSLRGRSPLVGGAAALFALLNRGTLRQCCARPQDK